MPIHWHTSISDAVAAGWLPGYSFRQDLYTYQLNGNNTETPGTDYQIPIMIDSGSNDGTEYMFVVQDYFPTGQGRIGLR